MTPPRTTAKRRRRLWAAVVPLLLACSPDEILDVDDPDITDPGVVTTPEGAEALRVGALRHLNVATAGVETESDTDAFAETMFMLSGLMADEYRSGDTFIQRNETDQRAVQSQNANVEQAYRALHRARLNAQFAGDALAEFAPDAPQWHVGQMLFVQGYTETLLAEFFCSGVPLSTVSGTEVVAGEQLTTEQLLEQAIVHLDSALLYVPAPVPPATALSAEEATVRYAALTTKGRALVNLARYAEAAAAVAEVPDDFQFRMEASATPINNGIWEFNNNVRRFAVADTEGTNGLDFVSARDPRLPTCVGGDPTCRANGVTSTRVFDTQFASLVPFNVQLKWPTLDAPTAIVEGTEARLIQAEAQLAAGDGAWLATLNDLRLAVPGLAPLADPGDAAARVDLLFRERAFWLFSTGHRLGDLRRLVRQYGRPAESVFPTGAYVKGGAYGTDVSFPISQAEENNPNVPEGATCLNRDA